MLDMPTTDGGSFANPPDRQPVSACDINIDTPAVAPDDAFWPAFGLIRSDTKGGYGLPTGVVAFQAEGGQDHSSFGSFLMAMETPPLLVVKHGGRQQALFRLADPALVTTLARSVPDGVTLVAPGEPIALPTSDWQPSPNSARSIAELSEVTAVEVSRVAKADITAALPAVTRNPLIGFSLRGQSAVFREKAIDAEPLLGDLCLSGQVTVWYAAPNTGKTLIALSLVIDAVKAGRIDGGNVFYINADDSSEGLATKMELMDDLGVHTLATGFKGFVPGDLIIRLHQMADRDEARGVLIVIDTTKKFVSLMDKKDSSNFGTACRRVAMAGGAVLNLAHTTKRPNADGTPCFAGTTDMVDDADAAYTIRPSEASGEAGEKIVEFACFKQRGDNAQMAAYAYAAENGVSYPERLASVRSVDPATLDEFRQVEAQRADEDVVQAIAASIADGFNTKMILGKEAAARAKVSARHAYRLIERYTGDNPAQHRWRFTIRDRGAKAFELLPPPTG